MRILLIFFTFMIILYEMQGIAKPQERLNMVALVNSARKEALKRLMQDNNVLYYISMNLLYYVYLTILLFYYPVPAITIFLMGLLAAHDLKKGKYDKTAILVDASMTSILLIIFLAIMIVEVGY